MSMRRDTEFSWQPQSGSRSKLVMSLLLCVAGLATGYMFVHAGRQPPAKEILETAKAMVVPARSAIEEHSGIATAALLPFQLLNPASISRIIELASDEPGTVAIGPPPLASTVKPPRKPAPVKLEIRQRRTSGYATLRQALLRNVR